MTDALSTEGTATTGTTVLVGKLFRVQRGRGKRFEKERPKEPEERPARIALQLALAHRIQRAIDTGELKDQAEAARLLGLTRARVSQLLDLTLLAPDIQERVLSALDSRSASTIGEHRLRAIASVSTWAEQRASQGRGAVFGDGARNAAMDNPADGGA